MNRIVPTAAAIVATLLGIVAGCTASAPDDDTTAGVKGCDRRTIGEEDGDLVGAHEVIDGEIVGVCFGEPDPDLARAWEAMQTFTTAADRAQIAVFAGFRGTNGTTLAFAAPLDMSLRQFVIAVDIDAAADDPAEFQLTLAHEFAHVFTQRSDQISVKTSPADCTTFHNGNGCFVEGSFMADWVDAFWPADRLDSLPRDGSVDESVGEKQCSLVAEFLGPYAAAHPEEDFAETFSAWVFDVPTTASLEEKIAFFDDRVQLAPHAQRAEAAGATGIRNDFGGCG